MPTPSDREDLLYRRIDALLTADPVGRGTAALQNACGQRASEVLRDAARTFQAGPATAAIVTGFCIADAPEPAAETDGPLGAIYLARTLLDFGHEAILVSDDYGVPLLEAGCDTAGLPRSLVHCIPFEEGGLDSPARQSNEPGFQLRTDAWVAQFLKSATGSQLTHLIALERAGPSHTAKTAFIDGDVQASAEEFNAVVPASERNVCHNMRGNSINAYTAKSHRLFEIVADQKLPITTIGMADGGNEIGFGAIAWPLIRHAIAGQFGSQIACRISVDHLLIGGVSDWAAYALALAIRMFAGKKVSSVRHEIDLQRRVLETIVRETNAVDGITRGREPTVDSLSLDRYLEGLQQLLMAAEVEI